MTCMICGIKEGFHLYTHCIPEAKKWGIELVEGVSEQQEHVWWDKFKKDS